ncbi:MAG: hypothetical protein WC484_06695 [Candidatus Omnitrophota bacterium]|jgi:hypothetical protein
MNGDTCFVDTVCWIALLNKHDNLHDTADILYKKWMKAGSRFVTTSSVFIETANALCDPAFKPSVITFRQHLDTSSRLEIIFVNPVL